ncbi:hypothetical protein HNQ59_003463 [Chitinivorax tropicus]|uniref:DUF6970 domain-containing protein n=1 Tax=Chitinivorax tropicus TaxID=714531 RepID=A0A840MST4_9PROT|nr:hypothetical protein [Chitinivorax tropicus]MBB5020149.1 hypothetical protein [Chitinivorax tropicus]
MASKQVLHTPPISRYSIPALVIALASLAGSATATDTPPTWLRDKIRQFETEPVTNPPRQVIKSQYRGKTVYYVPAVCCDRFSELYDSNGQTLCSPDGGIVGDGDGRCPDFKRQSPSNQMIWQDSRDNPAAKR